MNYEQRKPLMQAIEAQRQDRSLICYFNFDRLSDPVISGLSTQFASDSKESLFRVLKESSKGRGIDLCVYTRGGDANSVWPVVSLLREFDKDFCVLAPYRCHSSGTLLAIGAKKIVLGPLSELSPIDPTTGNQFNPADPATPSRRLGISVEDVRAYKVFIREQLLGANCAEDVSLSAAQMQPFVEKLIAQVHPLALGNVQRVLLQIEQLAERLLRLHDYEDRKRDQIIEALTSKFYSHLHMISRHEAKEILGQRVEFASKRLANALDVLLRAYEDTFRLRETFYLSSKLAGQTETTVRFVGAAIESRHWSYLFVTRAVIRQRTKLPPNVQVQVPPGQGLPVIAGLPRETDIEILDQGWIHNAEPLGVTV